jgi:hypothetical protein
MRAFVDLLWWPVVALLGATMCLGGIWFFSRTMLRRHAADIRTTWYFFFLIAIATFIVGQVCADAGLINAKGEFQGAGGDTLNRTLKYVFALNEHLAASLGIVLLILGPQIGSYLLAGALSGCAAPPRYSGVVVRFSMLLFAKSLVLAAGVLLGLGVLGGISEWAGLSTRKIGGMLTLSLYLQLAAFYFLSARVEIDEVSLSSHEVKPPSAAARLHRWMTRNMPA